MQSLVKLRLVAFADTRIARLAAKGSSVVIRSIFGAALLEAFCKCLPGLASNSLGTMAYQYPAEPGAAAPIMTVPAGTGAPITTMGAMPAYSPATTTGVPILSSSAAAAAPMAAPIISSYGGYGYGGYSIPSALDHSQGKWFMPGEALPPGYVVTAHPEGGAL